MLRQLSAVLIGPLLSMVTACALTDNSGESTQLYKVGSVENTGLQIENVESKHTKIVKFTNAIDEIVLNPVLPLALVTTYDRNMWPSGVNTTHTICDAYIVDLVNAKAYSYSDTCSSAATSIWSPDGKHALHGRERQIVASLDLVSMLEGKDVEIVKIDSEDSTCGGLPDNHYWGWLNNHAIRFTEVGCGTRLFYHYDLRDGSLVYVKSESALERSTILDQQKASDTIELFLEQ